MLLKSRYQTSYWSYVDCCSYICMYSWLFFLSSFSASYICLTEENALHKLMNFCIKGPLSAFFCLLFLPLGIFGSLLWIVVCVLGKPAPYSYWQTNDKERDFTNRFTVVSANLCLLPDVFSKFNNNSFTYARAVKIAKRIISSANNDRGKSLQAQEDDVDEDDDVITTKFPRADFICFQEVWERLSAWLLIAILKECFSYFLYDVGDYRWNTNLFCLGSGLMFASRYPINDVDFKSFRVKSRQSIVVSLGLLQVKVTLSTDGHSSKVGYISTTHLQSYQGKKPCIIAELDETLDWLKEFRQTTSKPNESVVFDVVCGDFNFDNLSPGDQVCTKHALFNDYVDPCRMKAGQDCEWTIGTEMRQLMLWEEDLSSPEKFKQSLRDPILRRCYILDADVQVQTIRLAYLKAPFDKNGTIQFSPVGGKRRIDYILYNNKYPQFINNFKFITALNQLTDHIPISMTFEIK